MVCQHWGFHFEDLRWKKDLSWRPAVDKGHHRLDLISKLPHIHKVVNEVVIISTE